MIEFKDWIMREEATAATAATASPANGGTANGSGTSVGSVSSTPSDSKPGSGSTTTDNIAKVPLRLGCCGFCYPYCNCKKKRKKK